MFKHKSAGRDAKVVIVEAADTPIGRGIREGLVSRRPTKRGLMGASSTALTASGTRPPWSRHFVAGDAPRSVSSQQTSSRNAE